MEDDRRAGGWSQDKDDFSWLVMMWGSKGQVGQARRPRAGPRWSEDSPNAEAANKRFRTIMAVVYLAILLLAMILPLVLFRS